MMVDVQTGSRLHFGLICGSPNTGWQFGGVGVMLRTPAWRLSFNALASGTDDITASDESTRRVQEFVTRIRHVLPLPPVSIKVFSEVPFHTGLGSGTQLGLAIAAAAHLIVKRQAGHDPYELALLAQRAERSAIGTIGFRDGGFLVDYGVPETASETRRVERLSMPEAWRFLLIRPKDSQGLSGDRERQFFDQRVQMPAQLVGELAELISNRLVPSIRHHDFDDFSVSLETYGNAVGNFYAVEQGDVFAHPAIRRLVARLRSHGVHGAAQSSWGPGISVPAHSMSHAEEIAKLIPASAGETDFIVEISEPMNVGASLRTRGPESHDSSLA